MVVETALAIGAGNIIAAADLGSRGIPRFAAFCRRQLSDRELVEFWMSVIATDKVPVAHKLRRDARPRVAKDIIELLEDAVPLMTAPEVEELRLGQVRRLLKEHPSPLFAQITEQAAAARRGGGARALAATIRQALDSDTALSRGEREVLERCRRVLNDDPMVPHEDAMPDPAGSLGALLTIKAWHEYRVKRTTDWQRVLDVWNQGPGRHYDLGQNVLDDKGLETNGWAAWGREVASQFVALAPCWTKMDETVAQFRQQQVEWLQRQLEIERTRALVDVARSARVAAWVALAAAAVMLGVDSVGLVDLSTLLSDGWASVTDEDGCSAGLPLTDC